MNSPVYRSADVNANEPFGKVYLNGICRPSGLKARVKSQREEEAAVAGSELYCLADIPGLNPHSNLGGRLFSLNGNTALGSPLTAQQETGSLVPDTPAKAIEPGIRDAGPSRNEENKNKYFY
ncbi:unnamed protein product [Boreogadus saida]